MFDTPVEKEVLNEFANQLFTDDLDADSNKPISLLAKWLPSINASSKVQKERAKKIIKSLLLTPELIMIKLLQ